MRKWMWDVAAGLLVAALGVAYIGYLVRGTMPLITDARGMAGAGLVLGAAALVAAVAAIRPKALSRTELGLGAVTLLLGVVALAVAETFAAHVLLAVFMGAILVTGLYMVGRHLSMKMPIRHHGHRIAH